MHGATDGHLQGAPPSNHRDVFANLEALQTHRLGALLRFCYVGMPESLNWPLVIELGLRDPLAFLEIMEGRPEIAKALITWPGFPAASPHPTVCGAQSLSHLISIRKSVKMVSPQRTFLGTWGRDPILVFLLFYFISFIIPQ